MKKGFTLIELLAVIIILAILALIATPVVIKVVNNAKESARKSSVAGYADAVKLAINEKMFENKGSSPVINNVFLSNITYQGSIVSCNEVKNTNNYGVILKECTVATNTNLYCFAKGKVYSCNDTDFINIYNNMDENKGTPEVPIYSISKGVNNPQLASGMTPIKWVDGVETETTIDDSDWYDYSNKLWANAKTNDGSYWVWIPRYAYKVTSGWHKYTAGTIDIIFLKEDTIENDSNETIQTSGYDVNGTNTSNAYFLEPAFQNETGNTKYGFWVAKFEMSNTIEFPQALPNVASLRSVTIGDMFTYSQEMANNSNYGWTNVDTHLITNYEWGAVTYLSWSTYGKNSAVWINNSRRPHTTGCAGNSVSASYYDGCQHAYNTEIGGYASTTGNVTGIYDMSGGSYEYVAAYVNTGDSTLTTYGSSILAATKNKNVYSNGAVCNNYLDIYLANKNVYGDAVYETSNPQYNPSYAYISPSSWNYNTSYVPVCNSPWFTRGDSYYDGTGAGLFSFNPYNQGAAGSDISFHVAIGLEQ